MVGSTADIGGILNMLAAKSGISTEMIAKTTSPSFRQNNEIKDSIAISPGGEMLRQFLSSDMQADSPELDFGSLTQLRQQGDMLANLLQTKLKNFESNLITGLKNAGLDAMNEMKIQKNDDGISILNDIPNKDAIENFLNKNETLSGQFKEIAQFSKVLEMFSSAEPVQNNAAARYAQQSHVVKNPNANFVTHIMKAE